MGRANTEAAAYVWKRHSRWMSDGTASEPRRRGEREKMTDVRREDGHHGQRTNGAREDGDAGMPDTNESGTKCVATARQRAGREQPNPLELVITSNEGRQDDLAESGGLR